MYENNIEGQDSVGAMLILEKNPFDENDRKPYGL